MKRPIATLVTVLLLWVWVPVSAGPRSEPQAASPLMTSREIAKRYHELKQKGWSGRDFATALEVSRRDRELFDLYIQLHRTKISPSRISEGFRAARGNPTAAREYWRYVSQYESKNGITEKEIRRVFRVFPPNAVTRWQYFQYRTGAHRKDQDKDQPTGPRKKKPAGYSTRECLTVFRAARFDVTFVKQYFEQRDSKVHRSVAMRELLAKVKEAIEKEEQERKQKAEQEKRKAEEKALARKKLEQIGQGALPPGKDAGRDRKSVPPISEEELEKLQQGMTDEGEVKAQKPEENGGEGEPEEEAGENKPAQAANP